MADDHEFDHLPVELVLRPEIRRGSAQFREKPTHEQRLINEALDLLTAFGVPLDDTAIRLRERIALAVLAASDVKRSSDWRTAKSRADGWGLTTREIINYCNENFGGEDISSGSYDDVRRKHLIRAFEAGVIVPTTPDSSRNDPTRRWVLSDEFAPAVRAYRTPGFAAALDRVMAGRTTLAARWARERELARVPIEVAPGIELSFGPGPHNQLFKAVIEQFLPRFGRGAQVLYVGDAEKRDLYKDEQGLRDVGFFELDHAELPDVVAYSRSAGWLFVIEAVHSSGPISHIRVARLRELLKDSPAGIVFVTAFADRATFRKCVPEIAWETEVWISSDPDHLIHFNGDRFLGPHAQQ
jgi:type II restriction enzyme